MHSNHFVSFFRFSIWNFVDWNFNTDTTCFVTEEYIRCMGWAPYVVTFPDTVLCSLLRPVRHVSVRMDASSVLRINYCKLWSESSNAASCLRAEQREDCWTNALHVSSFSCDCESEVIQINFFSVLMQFIAYNSWTIISKNIILVIKCVNIKCKSVYESKVAISKIISLVFLFMGNNC